MVQHGSEGSVLFTMLLVSQTIQCLLVGSLMSSELERTWKGVVMAYSRYYPGICLVRMSKTTKASGLIASVPAEIQTNHFLNTSLDQYHYTSMLGSTSSVILFLSDCFQWHILHSFCCMVKLLVFILILGPHERTKCVHCNEHHDICCRNRKKLVDPNIRGTRAHLDGHHDVLWFSGFFLFL
jgi:hypothetical protein